PPPQSPGDRPGAHAVPTRRSSDLRGGEDVGRGALPDLLDEGGGAREVELELDPLVLGLEALAELLEGLLQGGRREDPDRFRAPRSEEHTSELQSRFDLVCRLLLER